MKTIKKSEFINLKTKSFKLLNVTQILLLLLRIWARFHILVSGIYPSMFYKYKFEYKQTISVERKVIICVY